LESLEIPLVTSIVFVDPQELMDGTHLRIDVVHSYNVLNIECIASFIIFAAVASLANPFANAQNSKFGAVAGRGCLRLVHVTLSSFGVPKCCRYMFVG
jgi:hypothetical protein